MEIYNLLNKELHLIEGDITTVEADVIVNAANSSLMGGGGVDGAIHRKGGPEILLECKKYRSTNPPLPTGQVIITTAGRLPAQKVIHTVGPIWQGGNAGEPGLLANAYRNSLQLADSQQMKSIAFPSISTGIYGFPVGQAVQVVRNVLQETIPDLKSIEIIKLVLFSPEDFKNYLNTFNRIAEKKID